MKRILTKSIKRILMYTFVFLLAFWVAGPFLWIFITSISSYVELLNFPPHWFPKEPTINSYLDIFFPYRFGTEYRGENVAVAAYVLPSIRNSLIVASAVTIFNLIIGSLAGYGYSRYNFRGKMSFLLLMMLTRLIPSISLVIPFFIMFRTLHLMNNLLGLFIAYNSVTIPLTVWIMYSYITAIPKDLDDAAMIDGCNRIQIFYKIILPISGPGLLASGIFSFMISWNEFLLPLIIIKSRELSTITLIIPDFMGQFSTIQAWPTVAAAGILACIPPLIIILLFEKYLVSGLLAGAKKG
jgi:multiple sugar transport system permease protein